MSSAKLKNAPLKEVIFELHWECTTDNNGVPYDAGFDLSQGKFAEKLKSTYPLHRKLIPEGALVKLFGVPMHQYWKGEFIWPVVQHGQGMIAVNEVEQGYEWEFSYKPVVVETIHQLIASYEEELSFNRTKLQYIDAWDLNGVSPTEFIAHHLQTEISNAYDLPGHLKSINIQQNFELQDGSIMSLNIANGINNQNQQPSVIWTTTVERQSKMSMDEVVAWLESAHTATSSMFKKMLNPEFYASLDR
jgi:uncharacterized protein (TIGR04255 family)